MYLGIDNANDGAACLIDKSQRLLVCISWRMVTRKKIKKFEISVFSDNKTKKLYIDKSFLELGKTIYKVVYPFCVGRLTIGIEDTFVRNNVKTCITLTKNNSYVSCILEHLFKKTIHWVAPQTWRSSLGFKKQKRDLAKQASLNYIPNEIYDLDLALSALGRLDHITDSAGIALHLLKKEQYGRKD